MSRFSIKINQRSKNIWEWSSIFFLIIYPQFKQQFHVLSRHASKFMDSCITYGDRLHSIFSKKKRTGHVGQGACARGHMHAWQEFSLGSWWDQKGICTRLRPNCFWRSKVTCVGPDGRRSWDHSSHIVCVVAVRGHAPAPAAAESVVVSLPSLDFQAEWMQKDGHGRRPGCRLTQPVDISARAGFVHAHACTCTQNEDAF